ncbi:MAG: DNA primase [Mycoplasmataceae bacterium]|nr:DNA primase [Mycoplasmataceae bacterium]
MNSSIINEILHKSDIVEVISEFINLSKTGKNYKGICTVHNDTSPSLSVSEEKQFFKCFSCGISGNVISFLEKFQGMSKKDSIIFLAQKYDINYKSFDHIENTRYNENQKKIIKVLVDATNKFSYDITFQENSKAINFLKVRNLNSDIQNMFSIGYAKPSNTEGYKDFLLKKDNDISTMINASLINEKENQTISDRIIFPIKNDFGDIVGLSARTLDPSEKNYKYINSSDSIVFNKSSIIYNFWRAKEVSKELYLVEGFMDVIAFARVGLYNSIALMGTSISEIHTKKLKNHSIVLFLDNDTAGLNATLKSIFFLFKVNIDVNVIRNSSIYDPDEFLNTNGEKQFLNLLNERISGIEFIYQHLLKTIDLSNSNNIKPFINKLNNYLKLCDQIIKSQYSNKISNLLNIDILEINKILNITSFDGDRQNRTILKKNVTNGVKDNKIKDTYIFININRLLLGMLKNPKLIEIYLSEKPFLGTSKYMQLASYIMSKKDDSFVENEQLELELKEIEKTKNYPKTNEEFLETIENIQKDKVNIKLNQNNIKLKNILAKNPDDQLIPKILQSSIKAKKVK